ncbi:MAG TPA: polysaccharide biosynthesis tyrosine autokinase [Candidatus Binataceae bacterium]|jgi:capsular exopolysaccharide synthesis family protein
MEPSRYFVRRTGGLPVEAPIETEASPIFLDEGQPLVDFPAYWRIIRKHYRLVIAMLAGVVTLTMIKVMTETPMYEAETTIMVEPAAQAGGTDTLENLVQIEAAANNSDQYYKTQCAILESRGLAATVIKKLDLEHNVNFAGKPATPGLFANLTKKFRRAIHEKTARNEWPVQLPPGYQDNKGVNPGLVHEYLNQLKVTQLPDTNLVKISVMSPSAELAAVIANAHVNAFEEQQGVEHGEQNEEAQRYLKLKLVEVKNNLAQSEIALNAYRREKGIIPGLISLDGKDAIVLDRLSDLSKDLTAAQVQRISLEAQVSLIKKHQYNQLPSVIDDPSIQSMAKELDGLYSQRAALASQFKASYPPLAKLDAEIGEMQARIAAMTNTKVGALQSQYEEADAKVTELQDEMDKQRQETLKLNDAAAQYGVLQRDVDTNRELYNAILTRIKDVEMQGDIRSKNVSVINHAEVPGAPTSPRKLFALMLATMGGLGLGLALAFIVEMSDNTLKNPEEAENYLKLPNLGVVPEFSSVNGKSAYAPRELLSGGAGRNSTVLPPGRELVTTHGSYSRVGEAYRNLRTALLLSRAGGPPKVTLITSAMSREGKTVTAVNISVMLSQLGGNVLLIDADLRRARCHRVLAVDNHLGLTEVLTGSRDLVEMIRATEIDKLFFLSAGSVPPNPTELLNSPKMAEVMLQLRENYEYVVIDSAPVLPVSDSMVLSKLTDGVVLVANGSATPRQQVKNACARLEYARAKILGLVLNKVKIHSPDYHYYYHQDYYSFDGDSMRDDDEPV